MTVIETNSLSKVYNPETIPVHALNKINLVVDQGEFSAVVGPSGCGKTTLLNIIGGLDTPTQGSVKVGGTEIGKLKEKALTEFRLKNIGFVFQSFNLIPVLTAKENVEFIMLLQHMDVKEREHRTLELLEKMGLHDQVNRRPAELSGGQQQRVAVARALASKPKFILADEPTANLDSKSTSDLLDLMAQMNDYEQVTFIFSTHDQRVIDKARRIITLEDGKVVGDEKRKVLTT